MLQYLKDNKKKILCVCARLLIFGILTMVLEMFCFGFINADISVPINYYGDGITGLQGIDNVLNGSDSRLGWPLNENFSQYSQKNGMMSVAFKWVCGLFTSDPVKVFNVYLFVIPWFNVMVFYFVMKSLNVRDWLAYLSALTFGFCPYVQYRYFSHMLLGSIECIPLLLLLCIWCLEDSDFNSFSRNWYKKKRNWIGLLFAWMIADNGMVYYPFFSCYVLVIVFFVILLSSRPKKRIAAPLICIGEIGLFEALTFVPVVFGMLAGKGNVAAAGVQRSAQEAEFWGLKLKALIVSPNGYGIPWLREKLSDVTAVTVESDCAYVGIAALVGAIILFLTFLAGRFILRENGERETVLKERITFLSKAVIAVLLLGMISGLGSVVAILIPMIRCYNRISPFVVGMCVMAVALVLDHLLGKSDKKSRNVRLASSAGTALFFVLALFEQSWCYSFITKGMVSQNAEIYNSDQRFFGQVEARAGDGGMVFQLPYMRTFENGPVNNITDYDHLRCILNTKTLKWTYGAQNGSMNDKWYASASQLAPGKMAGMLSKLGFSGIYLNLNGYGQEEGESLKNSLMAASGCDDPIYSDDGKLVYISLENYDPTAEVIAVQGFDYDFGAGFSTVENDGAQTWIWCDQTGEMILHSDIASVYHMTFKPQTTTAEEYSLTVEYNGQTETYPLSLASGKVDISLEVPEGDSVIRFSADCPQVEAPGDSRSLYFRLNDLKITKSGDLSGSSEAVEYIDYMLGSGFSARENDGTANWIWCSQNSEIALHADEASVYMIRFIPRAAEADKYSIFVEYNGKTVAYPISSSDDVTEVELSVPAGDSIVKLYSDCPRIEAPGDERELYFCLYEFDIRKQSAGSQQKSDAA